MKRRFGLIITLLSLTALLVGIVGVATVEASKKKGSEGCTPGYWKQSQHFDSWQGYTPSTQFSAVFENAFPGKTFLQVLQPQNAGPDVHLNALGRQAVAALLNVASGSVDYPYDDVSAVINQFNAVFPGGDYDGLKDIFEGFNTLGCPLT